MAGVGDETPHPLLRSPGAGLAVRSRQVSVLDAGQHHVQRFGQPPDLGVLGGIVDAPGEVTVSDRRSRRLDLPERRQASPHQRQADACQQHDGDAPGQRVGYLQVSDRAVEIAETVCDDQITAAGLRLRQDAPGTPRGTSACCGERRSGLAQLRRGQSRSARRAQRTARHADLPVGADHLDQKLRGQRLRTAAAVSWLELLPLHDAARDGREVPELGV